MFFAEKLMIYFKNEIVKFNHELVIEEVYYVCFGTTYLTFCWKCAKIYLYLKKVRKCGKKWGFKKVVHKS